MAYVQSMASFGHFEEGFPPTDCQRIVQWIWVPPAVCVYVCWFFFGAPTQPPLGLPEI